MWGSGQLKHLPTVSFSQRVSERKDEKRALFRLMEIQRQVLLGYEAQHENISRPQSTPQLPDVERELESVFALPQDQQQTWYDNQLNNLEQVRRRENQLRLEGDEFHVWESGSMKECVLEITDLSEIRIHQVAVVASQHRTPRNKLEFLQRYAVEDAQQVSDQRVNEQRVCTGRWTIDMLSCIKPDSALDTLAQSKLMFDPLRGVWRAPSRARLCLPAPSSKLHAVPTGHWHCQRCNGLCTQSRFESHPTAEPRRSAHTLSRSCG
eukprot:c9085_g1_i2.p1 GENE.c9085_g1_i2~~c9085_g1_i2.p1  ORF type:complete len:265 (+),score=43.01 c9085_g1_i2:80-874(+)